MTRNHVLFLLTEAPLHAGDRPGSTGDIDLPIQKDTATGYPIIRGSTVRGCLRQLTRSKDLPDEKLFGAAGPAEKPRAGIVSFTDFHLLLYPVRTLTGLFAWVTTPFFFQHLKRCLEKTDQTVEQILLPEHAQDILVTPGSQLLRNGQISLEETVFPAQESVDLAKLGRWIMDHALPGSQSYTYLKGMALSSLALVPDEIFQKLLPLVMPVFPRIRIDPITGTVVEGALWNTEVVPSETLLSGMIMVNQGADEDQTMIDQFMETVGSCWFQIGGCKNVGMGIVMPVWR